MIGGDARSRASPPTRRVDDAARRLSSRGALHACDADLLRAAVHARQLAELAGLQHAVAADRRRALAGDGIAVPGTRCIAGRRTGRNTAGVALLARSDETVAADRRTGALVRIAGRLARARARRRVGAVALLRELLDVVPAGRVARAVREAVAGAVGGVGTVALLLGTIPDVVAAELRGDRVREADRARTREAGRAVHRRARGRRDAEGRREDVGRRPGRADAH